MTPREFLTNARWTTGGEYTCMRVSGDRIHSWAFHHRRLGVAVEAVEALHEQVVDAVRTQAALVAKDAATAWMATVVRANDKYLVHVCKMPSLRLDGAGNVAPIDVLVFGAPRSNAHIKHVQWIQDRIPIEQHARTVATSIGLADPFGEVLLHRHAVATTNTTAPLGEGTIDRTELLEGLITNFFVWRQGTVYTVGDHDDILLGSARHLVLVACRRLGIPVEFTPPRLEDAAAWDAAFVTSVVKLVVPVRAIYDTKAVVARLPSPPPPILDTIRDAVRQLMAEEVDHAPK